MAADGKLRVGDCFAGAGGLSLGLQNAGHTVVFAIEADPVFSRTFLKAHPTCPGVHREPLASVLRKIRGEEAGYPTRGSIDLLVGGSPCQPFSMANSRPSAEDDRTDLSFQFLEVRSPTDAAKLCIFCTVPDGHDDVVAAGVAQPAILSPRERRWLCDGTWSRLRPKQGGPITYAARCGTAHSAWVPGAAGLSVLCTLRGPTGTTACLRACREVRSAAAVPTAADHSSRGGTEHVTDSHTHR